MFILLQLAKIRCVILFALHGVTNAIKNVCTVTITTTIINLI